MTKLEVLTSFWVQFSLPTVQSEMDEVATAITARQDATDASRKALIEGMRDFKRDQPEEIRSSVSPLIKQFQQEVDSLSKRAKAAEKAFFHVYKKMADIADPVPILEHALEQQKSLGKIADMEIETKQLRETIGDYNKEIQEYKVKEKKMHELQAKVDAYDKNIDETLNERIKDVTERMLEEYNDKLTVIEGEKLGIERRAEDLESKYRTVQRQLTESQGELFEANNKKEEKRNAKSTEVDILINDLEMSNDRAANAERETQMLREKLDELRLPANTDQEDISRDTERNAEEHAGLVRELSAKEREVAQLVVDVQRVTQEREDDSRSAAMRARDLESQLNEVNKTVESQEAKLAMQADYESVKKDLAILKTLEFSAEDSDDESNKRPLEVLILERSKVLQSENTSLRMEKDRLSEELSTTSRDLSEKSREWERQAKLITELETHVEQLQDMSTLNRGEAEGRSSADILVDFDLSGKNSSMAAQEFEQLVSSPVPPTSSGSPSGGGGGDDSSKALLPIVQAQRERLRTRNDELEDLQAQQLSQLSLLQKEVEDMRTDNVKLYEKIRYLQGYQGRKQASEAAIPMVESRYKSQYESKLDPFSSFSHQERQRKYGQLNVVEKIILSFVQFMMSNKFARLFVFAYSLLLHALVFMVLMKLAYNEAYRRDLASEWHDKYMQHMEDAHEEHHG